MGGEASEGLACASLERGGTGPARRLFIPLFSPRLKPNQGRKSRISQSVAFTPQSFCNAASSEKTNIYQYIKLECAAPVRRFLVSPCPETAGRPRPHSGRRKPPLCAKAADPALGRRAQGPATSPPARRRTAPPGACRIIQNIHKSRARIYRSTNARPPVASTTAARRHRRDDTRALDSRRAVCRLHRLRKSTGAKAGGTNARLPIPGGQGISRGRDRRFAVAVETWPRG